MKFILCSSFIIVLITISAVSTQDSCAINAQNAIARHDNETAISVAAAAAVEAETALASNATITAVENKIAQDAQNIIIAHNAVQNASAATIGIWGGQTAFVAVQAAAYTAALRAAEAYRVTIATDQATANALASVKVTAALNVAVANCATIAALPNRTDTCGLNAINAKKVEIQANSDKVSAAALEEEVVAKAAAASIAIVKRSIVAKVNEVLQVNYASNVNAYLNESTASMASLLAEQAATIAFVNDQASLMIAGLQASENLRKSYVDRKAAAFAVSEANLLVALSAAVVACDSILALSTPAGPSCAFDAINAIISHIGGSADNVTAAASFEKYREEAASTSIAINGTLAVNETEALYIANNVIAINVYATQTVSEAAAILVYQATAVAVAAVNSAATRAAQLAFDASLAVNAAAAAAAEAVAVAARLAILNADLAAC